MAERKDEDHMDALRAIRREMEEQAVSATAIRSRLCAKLGGRFMKHWSEQLVADCWHAWCAQTNQRITWNIAVSHALARLQHSRVSIVFAEWSAWVEMQQAWAVMLSQGIESMSRVRLQFFFGRWSSYAARMATLDGIQRRAVQRLSHRQQSFAFEAWSMTACFRRRSRTVIERLRQSSDARLLLWSFASWQERTSDRITWKLALLQASARVQSLRRQAVFHAWHMYIKRRMERTVILKRSVLRMQMGVTGAAFDSWSEHHRRRAVAKRAMGRLANTRLCAVWGSFVEGVEVSMAERKDEDHMDALRAIRREMQEQTEASALSAQARLDATTAAGLVVQARLLDRLSGHFLRFYGRAALLRCWQSWAEWVGLRLVWKSALVCAASRLRSVRLLSVLQRWAQFVASSRHFRQVVRTLRSWRLLRVLCQWASCVGEARLRKTQGTQTRAIKDPAEAAQEARAEATATARLWLARIKASRAQEMQDMARERQAARDQERVNSQLVADIAQLRHTAEVASQLGTSLHIVQKRWQESLAAKAQRRQAIAAFAAWRDLAIRPQSINERLDVCLTIYSRRLRFQLSAVCFGHWLGVVGFQHRRNLASAARQVTPGYLSSDSRSTSEEEWDTVVPSSGLATASALASMTGQPIGLSSSDDSDEGVEWEVVAS